MATLSRVHTLVQSSRTPAFLQRPDEAAFPVAPTTGERLVAHHRSREHDFRGDHLPAPFSAVSAISVSLRPAIRTRSIRPKPRTPQSRTPKSRTARTVHGSTAGVAPITTPMFKPRLLSARLPMARQGAMFAAAALPKAPVVQSRESVRQENARLKMARSTRDCRSVKSVRDAPVPARMATLSAQYPRYGYRCRVGARASGLLPDALVRGPRRGSSS